MQINVKEKLLELHRVQINEQKAVIEAIEEGNYKSYYNGIEDTSESLDRARKVVEVLEKADEYLRRG